MTTTTTTTTKTLKINNEMKFTVLPDGVLPFNYSSKHGEEMNSDILHQIKGDRNNGKHFKINLYPASLKPSCRGQPDGRDLPQRNESYYYSSQPVGTKYYFYGPLREYNKEKGQFDTSGAYRTRWYIDSQDWALHQADYGSTYKWTREEYRIVLEPFQRAWNRAVVDIDANGPVYINNSLTPSQFSAFRARIIDQERLDTALLKRKHENQKKRKRAKTPSPTFSKERRKNILAHTSMQRIYTTAKLKHGKKMVFVTVGDFFHTYSSDAEKLAKHTDLHIQFRFNDWAPGQVVFPKKKLDYYRACCHQRGIHTVVV